MRSAFTWLAALTIVGAASADEPLPKGVEAILGRCVACHNPDEASGDLDLTTRAAALKGGESGPALKPGDPAGSRLYKLVAARKMPPKTPLSGDEVAAIEGWIKAGATWSGDLVERAKEAEADSPRWAFRPIANPPTPTPKTQGWTRDPIDDFILEKLEAKGLKPSPEAERRVWLRRVTFDLIGLPPTVEELEAFEADKRPNAYERVVTRLLDSPHYGERWARHWLDVARFAESDGFEYDQMRDNAWRYRDYVIKSFNDDKPFADFVREQIAGDALVPAKAEGIVATGFLVAGPWDKAGSGQANLVGRGRVREEELEDMVGLVGQTFLGLTVQCARCHAHKFDPIPQKDYYRIKAALEGVGHGDRPVATKAEEFGRNLRVAAIRSSIALVEKELGALDRSVRAKATGRVETGAADSPRPILRWTFETGDAEVETGLAGELIGRARVERGRLVLPGKGSYYRTASLGREIKAKTLEAWVYLADLDQRGGAAISLERDEGKVFDAVVYGERDAKRWMAGSEGFIRTQPVFDALESSTPDRPIHVAATFTEDGDIRLYREGKPYGKPYRPNAALQTYPGGSSRVLLGLRHTLVANGFLKGELEEARLYDRALTPEEVARSHAAGPEKVSAEAFEKALDPSTREKRRELSERLAQLRKRLTAASEVPLAYAAGPFDPPPTRVLARGDFETPGEVVSAGGLSTIKHPSSEFELKPDAPEAERRRKLAAWLADPANPLPPRVMVNRLWHYHFGNGLVATPSDFGANGGRPSHPALLDRLASDFLAGGGRLKPLHRRIVLSATYRQASTFDPKAAAVDADARLLWRFPPRRIEGEAVLDAMTAVTGRLDPTVGGPSFRPFTVTFFNANFYTPIDSDDPAFRRRMIYRIHVHSARSPLMESLDCPDPSVKTAKRNATVTPIQALALMNDAYVERQARHFADRVRREAGAEPSTQVEYAYKVAFNRDPSKREVEAAVALVREHPLDRLTWALLNANEFLYLR